MVFRIYDFQFQMLRITHVQTQKENLLESLFNIPEEKKETMDTEKKKDRKKDGVRESERYKGKKE